jgi:hypothetical protein
VRDRTEKDGRLGNGSGRTTQLDQEADIKVQKAGLE